MRIAYSEQDAWNQIDELEKCKNCSHYVLPDLFGPRCGRKEANNRLIGESSTCECFCAKEKQVKYWINKLVEMAQEYHGSNDFMRRWLYHDAKGTANDFLNNKQ